MAVATPTCDSVCDVCCPMFVVWWFVEVEGLRSRPARPDDRGWWLQGTKLDECDNLFSNISLFLMPSSEAFFFFNGEGGSSDEKGQHKMGLWWACGLRGVA